MARIAAFATGVLASTAASVDVMNFTVYSWPVELRYGQVHNRMLWNDSSPNELPRHVIDRYASGEKLMAVSGFDVDMVRIAPDGSESQVTLDDMYLHHYIIDFGETQSMRKMMKTAQQDSHTAHMLTGCHGMQGVGVHMFQRQMASEGSDRYKHVTFGSASGAEYRHNLQRFEAPYRLLLEKPEVWAPTLHIINTNVQLNKSSNISDSSRDVAATSAAHVSSLLECPCTPQREFNVTAGTIDGKLADPPIHCSPEFDATDNPSCHLSTYVGGWRCCEHDVFLVDTDKECQSPDCAEKPTDTVYMKFTFFYEDAKPEARQLESAACCDVTSDTQGNANIEYDIPACPEGTPADQCLHVAESVQPLAFYRTDTHLKHSSGTWQPSDFHASDLVDLAFAAPHLHWAGLSLELLDAETNETICEVHNSPDGSGGVLYGSGSAPGDENGYMVGLRPCMWAGGKAPRFRRDHKMRSRAIYNASTMHTGVMSLWLMQVSAVPYEIVV